MAEAIVSSALCAGRITVSEGWLGICSLSSGRYESGSVDSRQPVSSSPDPGFDQWSDTTPEVKPLQVRDVGLDQVLFFLCRDRAVEDYPHQGGCVPALPSHDLSGCFGQRD